ncbi:TIGR03086 family metal-binding protein [Mycolicibacterium tusciae]|uniref:TIGR03086 family metal-binding protein n=1 Tax=Mycolicibacterium tusciae TaxID=75922 RepID=UPI00024A3B2A|nr:TIGR03086 family metal-binding protein [Mycolicibacterium tusciae]
MNTNTATLPLHRTAVLASVDVVNAVTRDDLARPTPCAGWDLAALLAHMTVQHRGFAAAARGGTDLDVWDVATVADAVASDPAGTYSAAADDVLDAFEADGVLDATFALPEFGPDATFPGAMAIGFHFVDYVVHGWDVARSIGAAFEPPHDVIEAVLPIAFAVPDGEFRTEEGSPFRRAVAVDDDARSMDRILAHLGRSPAWTSLSIQR